MPLRACTVGLIGRPDWNNRARVSLGGVCRKVSDSQLHYPNRGLMNITNSYVFWSDTLPGYGVEMQDQLVLIGYPHDGGRRVVNFSLDIFHFRLSFTSPQWIKIKMD